MYWETGLDYSMSHRWTIDYPEDFALIKSIYEQLYPVKANFGLQDILNLIAQRPDIFASTANMPG